MNIQLTFHLKYPSVYIFISIVFIILNLLKRVEEVGLTRDLNLLVLWTGSKNYITQEPQ